MGSFNPGLKIMENMKNREKMENINQMIQTTLFMIQNILFFNQTTQNTLFVHHYCDSWKIKTWSWVSSRLDNVKRFVEALTPNPLWMAGNWEQPLKEGFSSNYNLLITEAQMFRLPPPCWQWVARLRVGRSTRRWPLGGAKCRFWRQSAADEA